MSSNSVASQLDLLAVGPFGGGGFSLVGVHLKAITSMSATVTILIGRMGR